MFNPLAFASSAVLAGETTNEVCGCGCTGVVGVQVGDLTVIVIFD